VIKARLADLQKVDETQDPGARFAKGDRIINFNGSDLRTIYPGSAAQVLHNWVITWTPGVFQARVIREGKEVEVTAMFGADNKDLRALLDHRALKPEVLAGGGASDRALVPADLVQRYRSGMEALPAGYQNLIPPAVSLRLKELLDRKMGSAEDADWFKSQVLDGMLLALETDVKAIRQKSADLELMVKDNPAPDLVILKDGSKVEGKFQEAGEGKAKVQLRKGARPILTDDIAQLQRDKGWGTEAAKQLAAAKGDVGKLRPVMNLYGSKGLTEEKQFVACQILLLDPADVNARTALGLNRPAMPGSK